MVLCCDSCSVFPHSSCDIQKNITCYSMYIYSVVSSCLLYDIPHCSSTLIYFIFLETESSLLPTPYYLKHCDESPYTCPLMDLHEKFSGIYIK